jgi:hypothetical protein
MTEKLVAMTFEEASRWIASQDARIRELDMAFAQAICDSQRYQNERNMKIIRCSQLEAALWDLIDMVGRYPHPTEPAKLTAARRLVLPQSETKGEPSGS